MEYKKLGSCCEASRNRGDPMIPIFSDEKAVKQWARRVFDPFFLTCRKFYVMVYP